MQVGESERDIQVVDPERENLAIMKLSMRPVRPCTLPATKQPVSIRGCTFTPTTQPHNHHQQLVRNWEKLFDPNENVATTSKSGGSSYLGSTRFPSRPVKLGKKWMEYQGIGNWEGLLDPLDDNLRREIIRYGQFVDAAYQAFDFDTSSPSYGTCQFPKNSFLDRSGMSKSGYRLTANLRATSGIQLPRWMEKAPGWMSTQSSWIGYVAVCQNKEEIARLGRRDIVISFRGTATCLEWLENLRATLTNLPNSGGGDCTLPEECGPMVESGFLSLYTSSTANCPSLQDMVRQEIARLLQSYGDEPLSLTITGHSLGAALATLAAYDIKTTFGRRSPLVTVISFGGPRVGNRSFRHQLENQGTKVLRIVNSDDLITKVPGFVIDNNDNDNDDDEEEGCDVDAKWHDFVFGLPSWIQKRVEDTQWVYAEVGRELRLSSKDSPYLNNVNVATCHELNTYLHLVDGFVSSTCPFKATAKRMLGSHFKGKVNV